MSWFYKAIVTRGFIFNDNKKKSNYNSSCKFDPVPWSCAIEKLYGLNSNTDRLKIKKPLNIIYYNKKRKEQ